MGRYFGIGNKTKKQKVSSYWKAEPMCNCHDVMHQLHWEATDEIYSASYCDYYEFKYESETNTMNPVDANPYADQEYMESQNTTITESVPYVGDDTSHEPLEEDTLAAKKDYVMEVRELTNEELTAIIFAPLKEENVKMYEPTKTTDDPDIQKLGFDHTLTDKFNHVPKWEGNKCACCGFIYDPSKLEEYTRKYDGTFCMN